MRLKKAILTLSGIFLLAACGGEETAEPDTDAEVVDNAEEVVEEPIAEETQELVEPVEEDSEENPAEVSEVSADASHTFDPLIAEDNFIEVHANQAWKDYKSVVADVDYGEVTILNQENPDFSEIEGTSSGEIEERFNALNVRDEVFIDTIEMNESEHLHFHRYPAKAGSEYSDISDFLAEITFYYVEDNLMFTSITPGLYSLELGNLPEASELTTYLTLSEIEALNPQVFTISEMKINGNNIQQIMIPATHVNEEGLEETLAFYFFTYGEDILYYAYIPFELVSQDFPSNSVAIYQQFIPEIEQMDLGDSL